MTKLLKIIQTLEDEIKTERERYYSDYKNTNESIRNWLKGYIKGIQKSIEVIQYYFGKDD